MKSQNKTALLAALLSAACANPQAPAPPPQASEQPKPVATPVDPRYETQPKPQASQPWGPPPVERQALGADLMHWHLERGTSPLVTVHFIVTTGSASDPVGKAGLTKLAADWLDEGAGKLGALELSEEFARLSTDVGIEVGLDFTMVSMSCLAENLEPSLALLADIVQRPQLRPAEFDRRKDDHVAQALARQDDPNTQMQEQLRHALFGEGYGGEPVDGNLSSLRSLTAGEARAHIQKVLHSSVAHLVTVGAVPKDQARALLVNHWKGWKADKTIATRKVASEAQGTQKVAYLIPFEGAAQSALGFGKRAGAASDPNYFRELLMNHKLGGSFTSRINLNLREDKGYTYGAFSSFQRFKNAGFFSVSANVIANATGPAAHEVEKELADYCGARPLTQAERDESSAGLLLGYPLRFEAVADVARQVATLPIYDRPLDFWSVWPKNVASVSTEQAHEAARPYCDPSQYAMVVAGDPQVVTPQLEALGRQVVLLPRAEVQPDAKRP
jgi:zinc protease